MRIRREKAVVAALACLSVAFVGLAAAVKSYVPLFLGWLPLFAVPLVLSRSRPKPHAPVPTDAGRSEADA